jgi:hypothetical protein
MIRMLIVGYASRFGRVRVRDAHRDYWLSGIRP